MPSPYCTSVQYRYTRYKDMWTYEVGEGEALVEGDNVVERLDLLMGERDFKCIKVLVEVPDLAATDDGEDVGCFLHSPSDSD